MNRKKEQASHENHERWLVSYADFITLLFAFFVVMFATSQTDRGKTQQMQEAMKKAIQNDKIVTAIAGILGGTPDDKGVGNAQWRGPGGSERLTAERPKTQYMEMIPAAQFLAKELEQEIKEGKIQISMEPRGLVVSLQQAAFFPSGDDRIPESSFGAIAKVAEVIAKVPNPVRLEGHTDSQPLRPNARFHSNWDLSAARAIAVMELLVACCELPTERFSVAGYAENSPVADNSTDEGRSQNRRVNIVILNQLGARDEPERPAVPR